MTLFREITDTEQGGHCIAVISLHFFTWDYVVNGNGDVHVDNTIKRPVRHVHCHSNRVGDGLHERLRLNHIHRPVRAVS